MLIDPQAKLQRIADTRLRNVQRRAQRKAEKHLNLLLPAFLQFPKRNPQPRNRLGTRSLFPTRPPSAEALTVVNVQQAPARALLKRRQHRRRVLKPFVSQLSLQTPQTPASETSQRCGCPVATEIQIMLAMRQDGRYTDRNRLALRTSHANISRQFKQWEGNDVNGRQRT